MKLRKRKRQKRESKIGHWKMRETKTSVPFHFSSVIYSWKMPDNLNSFGIAVSHVWFEHAIQS